jgi:hypothetical protein
MSQAFYNTQLYQTAIAALRSPEWLIDSADSALEDMGAIISQVESLDIEHTAEPVHDPIPESQPPVEEPVSSTMDIDPDPARLVPLIPNLQLPALLSMFNFGLLTLVNFPSEPIVPVCLICRKVIHSAKITALTEHFTDNHKTLGPSSIQLKPYEATIVTPLEAAAMFDEELEGEPKEEELPDGVLDRNDEQNLVMQEDEVLYQPSTKRYKFGPLHEWFKTSPITIFPEERPPTLIPAIPFFILHDGLGCPVESCLFVSLNEDTIKRHIWQHGETDTYPEPVQCKVQSLNYRQGNSPYFPVIPPPESLPAISIDEKMLKELVKERASTNVSGIEYANAFMLRFKYRSIYPDDPTTYNDHAAKYIVKATILHDRNQEFWEHLLTLGCFAYVRKMYAPLRDAFALYQRLLGWELM